MRLKKNFHAKLTCEGRFSKKICVGNHPCPQVQWPQPQACPLLSPLISAKLLAFGEVVANNEINRLTSLVPHSGQCTTAGFFSRTNSSKRFSQLVQ
jgi:hypothetical protein